MRLLRTARDHDFQMSSFDDEDVPPYAILSHTWGRGEEDEVTFKDIADGTGKGKKGFGKLKFCNDQADIHGLCYFWVDTCCIDKSSSTELVEAINSMFRWYQRAERCYVHLADVSVRTADGEALNAEWESMFRCSRWFTRGWTLQELLAPKKVEFYSRDRVYLGNKAFMIETIHDVTGIALDVLQTGDLSGHTIDERLNWAKNRQTSKAEDKAYCLLGLCNVFMPLLYGEGHNNALRRLRNETMSDRSNAASENMHLFIVPLERNPHFTGRESELTRLEQALSQVTSYTAKAAIVGLGGVGKTQLAVEFLYRAKERHKDLAVFWIPATDHESLLQAYRAIADELDIPGRDSDSTDIRLLVKARLSTYTTGRWLLVFDNADDLEMWTDSNSGPRLIDCLPKSTLGSILFTTRNRRMAIRVAQQNVVQLEEMDSSSAVDLFSKYLIDPITIADRQVIQPLVEQLTYLPLAIRQASAYINANSISLAEYLTMLTEQDRTAVELLSEEFEDEGRYRSLKNPIAATWLISFERIQHEEPLAADYLSFMACIEPKTIPESLLPPGVSHKKELDAIGILSAYSFITRRTGHGTLDLHRLVHLATRNWLIEKKQLEEWGRITINRLSEVFPTDLDRDRPLWRQYLPHARRALAFRDNEVADTRAAVAVKFAACLIEEGRYQEAELSLLEALEVKKRTLGDEHPDTLEAMSFVVLTNWHQGRWAEAERLGIQVLETRKRVLGTEHRDTLESMERLADALADLERYHEAELLGLQALEIATKLLGETHLQTMRIMANLALIYQEQGRLQEAEQLGSQTLELETKVLGEDHPDTLTTTANLALTYWHLGRLTEAERLDLRTLERRKAVLGETHADTLTSMNNVAYLLDRQGRCEEALALMQECVVLSCDILGPEHPKTRSSKETILIWMGNGN